MKVRCEIKYLKKTGEGFVEIQRYESVNDATHMRLQLYSLITEVEERHGCLELHDEKKELLKSSEVFINETSGEIIYLTFHTYTWVYESKSQQLYINNTTISI